MRTDDRTRLAGWAGVAAALLLTARCRGRLGELPDGREAVDVLRGFGVLALVPAAWYAVTSLLRVWRRRGAGSGQDRPGAGPL